MVSSKPLKRACDKPMYGRVIERVDISDCTNVDHRPGYPWHVTVTFDIGPGAQFEFQTEDAARLMWRELVGLPEPGYCLLGDSVVD